MLGFLILTKATGQGAQPGTISKGFVHIIGGVLAINIVQTINMLQATVGLTMLKMLKQIPRQMMLLILVLCVTSSQVY